MAELKRAPVQPPQPEDRDGTSPWTTIGLMFLTFNSAMAVSSCHRGFGAMSFLVFSVLCLAMLFHCLRLYARTPPGSPRREKLKMTAWLLTTMLTIGLFQLPELWFVAVGKTENPNADF